MAVARPLAAVATAARPAIWLLSRSTDVVVRIFGGDPGRGREQVTEQELRELVAAQTTFSPHQRLIIDGAFEISERTLVEVMRPRPDVFTLDSTTRCSEARRHLADSGYSRAPVCRGGTLDDVMGIVHLRDLLTDDPDRTAGDVVHPLRVVPESARVLESLRDMQTGHTQMVIVVNEHGGAEGIVTVEDLVEELVGEIYDETDRDVQSVRHEADGSMIVTGRYPLHDLVDIGVEIPAGDYTTVAGFVLAELQRIPSAPGDVVEAPRWRFEVTGIEDYAITEVRIRRLESGEAEQDDDGRRPDGR